MFSGWAAGRHATVPPALLASRKYRCELFQKGRRTQLALHAYPTASAKSSEHAGKHRKNPFGSFRLDTLDENPQTIAEQVKRRRMAPFASPKKIPVKSI